MLIHLSPRLFTCDVTGPNCELIDLAIPELNLLLKGGKDLTSRRPYPNKRYVVACRNLGRKAISGLVIQAPEGTRTFTATARWAIDATLAVTHKVSYEIIDTDFDLVSDDMLLWSASPVGWGTLPCRWPDFAMDWTPANAQPRMDVSPGGIREGVVLDTFEGGLILLREEWHRLPTLEPERLSSKIPSMRDRLPAFGDAFVASGAQTAELPC